MLHFLVCLDGPLQGRPYLLGYGFLQTRVRDCFPPPQVLVHVLQLLHLVQPPCTKQQQQQQQQQRQQRRRRQRQRQRQRQLDNRVNMTLKFILAHDLVDLNYLLLKMILTFPVYGPTHTHHVLVGESRKHHPKQ